MASNKCGIDAKLYIDNVLYTCSHNINGYCDNADRKEDCEKNFEKFRLLHKWCDIALTNNETKEEKRILLITEREEQNGQ